LEPTRGDAAGMSRTQVLILSAPEDPIADVFRGAIETEVDPGLRERVDLHFSTVENAESLLPVAEVITCGTLPPTMLERAAQLRWLAFWSAGLDGKISEQMLQRQLLLTNASGVHGPNIAEHVLAMMLMFTRRMEIHLRSQIQGSWQRRMPFELSPAAELTGQTLCIVGYGRIGEALAVRAKAFGMRVIAIKRTVPDSNAANNSQLDTVRDLSALPDFLQQADHVCIALPYTRETHHLFNTEMLKHMKPSAYLYNIARGAIVDEAALVVHLSTGKLAGAGLDVFETEPLPKTSALWDLPNVILTPHVAGLTPHYFPRFASLFAANLHRYLDGAPLHNLYHPDRGY